MTTDIFNTIPDYIKAEGQTDLAKSLQGGGGAKRISIRGKRFRMIVGGKELATREENFLDFIVVNVAREVNRMYYADSYDAKAEKAVPPTCWSGDGRVPHPTAQAPQSATCRDCPQSVQGSGGGKSYKACRTKRRIAVVLAGDIEGGVYQFELPGTSVFGTGDKTHMPWDQYQQLLGPQGMSVDRVITRAQFDVDADQPKIVFTAVGFPTREALPAIRDYSASPEAKAAITMTVFQADTLPALPAPMPRAEPERSKATDLSLALNKFSRASQASNVSDDEVA